MSDMLAPALSKFQNGGVVSPPRIFSDVFNLSFGFDWYAVFLFSSKILWVQECTFFRNQNYPCKNLLHVHDFLVSVSILPAQQSTQRSPVPPAKDKLERSDG